MLTSHTPRHARLHEISDEIAALAALTNDKWKRDELTDAWLAAAEDIDVEVIKNRNFRERCGQGASFSVVEEIAAHQESDGVQPDAPILSSTNWTDRRPVRGQKKRQKLRMCDVHCNYWNAILSLAPKDIKNRDVLVACAQNSTQVEVAKAVGRDARTVRRLQKALLAWVGGHLTKEEIDAHLDDPITQETVVPRRPAKGPPRPELIRTVIELNPRIKRQRKPVVRRPRVVTVPRGPIDMWMGVAA